MPDEKQKELPLVEMKQEEYKAIQAQIANLTQNLQISQAIATKEKSRCEELSNLVTRTQADFDNFRKRNLEASKKLKDEGICEVIEKLIPVLDVLKQAIMMINDEKVAEGVKMIYRQIMDLLSAFGVTEIPALGEMFDPEIHNAIMQVKVKDIEKVGMVVEVFQKGYRMGERIIRHSVVKVAR